MTKIKLHLFDRFIEIATMHNENKIYLGVEWWEDIKCIDSDLEWARINWENRKDMYDEYLSVYFRLKHIITKMNNSMYLK